MCHSLMRLLLNSSIVATSSAVTVNDLEHCCVSVVNKDLNLNLNNNIGSILNVFHLHFLQVTLPCAGNSVER